MFKPSFICVCAGLVLATLAGCSAERERDIFADRVLPPWTDLTTSGGRVSVWNRTYTFADGPVPVSITSAGEELLNGPATLRIRAGGKAARWTARAATETGPVRWTRVSEAKVGKLSARATARLEYDGFCRVDLELTPHGPVELQLVELSIPLRREVAELEAHHVQTVQKVRSLRWSLHEQPERQWWAGKVPGEGMSMMFTPQVWLGDTDRGLAWCAETPSQWNPIDAQDAVTITPSGDSTTLTVRMVSEPRRLTGPVTMSFGLTATPVKPWRRDMANTRIVHSAAASGPDEFRERLMTPGVWAEEPIVSDLRDQVTLAAWVWPQERSRGFIFYGGTLKLDHLARENKLILTMDDSFMEEHTLEASVSLPVEQWHHLAASYDGETMRLYLDGKEIGRRDDAFEWRGYPSQVVCVGATSFGATSWHGRIDELGIFRRALDDDEISALMQGTPPEAAAIAGWWRFDEEPRDLIVTGDGPNHLALRLRSKRAGTEVAPVWADGVRGKAMEVGRCYAEITGNRDNLTGLQQLKAEGCDALVLWNNWSDVWGYPGVTAPENKAFLHELLDAAHAEGIKIIPYTSVAIIMENEPGFADVKEQVLSDDPTPFKRRNKKGFHVTKNMAWAEYYSRKLAEFAREFDIDGIYLDGGGLVGTLDTDLSNETVGAGGVVRYGVFGGRELMRRIACVFHGGVREDGLVLTHDSSPFVCSQDGFADVELNGELYYWLLAFRGLTRDRGTPVMERWPPALCRAWFTGETYGVPLLFVAKHRDKVYNSGERKLTRGALIGDDEIIAATALHGCAPMSNCSLRFPTGMDRPWWTARDLIGREGTTWHPYWRNEDLVSAEPQGVKVSLWRREQDHAVMLIIANLNDARTDARVTLEAEAPGATRWMVERTIPDRISATIEGDVVSVSLESGRAAFVLVAPAGFERHAHHVP
ncbi:MAG: hypothetical protein J7M38_00735, partial [Armatimonadetes bacterium]|nr:hypothetical protein [Armatimonadota bacterium]